MSVQQSQYLQSPSRLTCRSSTGAYMSTDSLSVQSRQTSQSLRSNECLLLPAEHGVSGGCSLFNSLDIPVLDRQER